jgi:acetolactate synthase I/III small subunit
MLRILSLFVENNPGVLARISGMVSGKGYNCESITAGVTADPTITRITFVCKGNDLEFEHIKKQLNGLINIIDVIDLTNKLNVKRELALIKVSVRVNQRSEIFHIADVFGCRILDVGVDSVIMEISDLCERIDDLLAAIQTYGIIEIARSGLIVMERCENK